MNLQEFVIGLKDKTRDDYLLKLQKLKESQDIIQEIISVLEFQNGSDLSNTICEAFYVMYTDKVRTETESHRVCLQFVPAIIWAYFCQLSKKSKSKPEAFLLAIYNQPSFSSSTLTLTETNLDQHEKSDKPILYKGPTKYLDHIPAGLRSMVISTILQEFNFSLSSYSRATLLSLCNLVLRLSISGYSFPDLKYDAIPVDSLDSLKNHKKIRISGKCVQEMVTALQYAAFNGLYEEARIAVKCLDQHCRYNLSFAGTLNTTALTNLLELSTIEDDNSFEITSPINPKKCCYRGKGKSSIISPQRPIFLNTKSIDRILPSDDSAISLNPSKSMISPSNISIQIDSPRSPTSSSDLDVNNENGVVNELFKNNDDDASVGKRTSTYTESEESEYENDKTPLIHGSPVERGMSLKNVDAVTLEQDGVAVNVIVHTNTEKVPKIVQEETRM